MIELLITSLQNWNAKKGERQKLQHSYLVTAVLVVLVAGIISLFNPDFGQDIARFALFLVAVFLVNAIAWNLLSSSLLDNLQTPTAANTPKRK